MSRRADAAALVRREQSAGDRLPYARHVDDHTLELRDGMRMQVIHMAGLPFETADSETAASPNGTAWRKPTCPMSSRTGRPGTAAAEEPCRCSPDR